MIKHIIYWSIIISLGLYCNYLHKYYKQTEIQNNYHLDEAPGEHSADIMYRIDMLQQHIYLNTNPSPKWINDVLSAAKYEITNYRFKN